MKSQDERPHSDFPYDKFVFINSDKVSELYVVQSMLSIVDCRLYFPVLQNGVCGRSVKGVTVTKKCCASLCETAVQFLSLFRYFSIKQV